MDELNTTVDKMNKEELQNEYLNLKTQNQALSKKLDDCEQQLYETKRQLTTSKLMEQELSTELESLQNEDKSESTKLTKKISSLEEEIVHLKQSQADEIQQYEQRLKEKDTELENLNEIIKNDSRELDGKNKEETISKLNDEVYELKNKIESLLIEIDDHEVKYEDVMRHNMVLENRLTDISNNLEEMREFLSIKKEELEASNERFQNLQEELMIMQMELDKFKNIPQDKATKGNSLFAEVEDNRQKLTKYIHKMNKKYGDMKLSYNRKFSELQELHSAYAVLKSAMEEKCNFEDDQAKIIESYENTVAKIKENVAALQKELVLRKEATEKILNAEQKSTEALIEISRKEVMELRTQLMNQQFSRIANENTLYETRLELKKWRLEALSLRSEVLIFKQTVEDLKLQNSSKTASPLEIIEQQSKTEKQLEDITNKGLEVKKQILKEEKEIKSVNKIENTLTKGLVFDEEKVRDKKCNSKYKGTGFWQQRTLTVVEKDLLDKSDSEKSDSDKQDYYNSISDLELRPKHKIPDLSCDADFCNDTFEEFGSGLCFKKPENIMDTLEKDLLKLNLGKEVNIVEENKENYENQPLKIVQEKFETVNNNIKSKKVTFSEETVENKKVVPRRGKFLVPKNVLNVSNKKQM